MYTGWFAGIFCLCVSFQTISVATSLGSSTLLPGSEVLLLFDVIFVVLVVCLLLSFVVHLHGKCIPIPSLSVFMCLVLT